MSHSCRHYCSLYVRNVWREFYYNHGLYASGLMLDVVIVVGFGKGKIHQGLQHLRLLYQYCSHVLHHQRIY